ncbi:CsgG/HfaB family protein [Candidatus Neomarinimicrobiota bacterium]
MMFKNQYRSTRTASYLSLVAALLCFQISAVSAQQISIAIMDFEGIGISTNESMTLTNRLRNELFKIGKFEVVERAMMETILAEQDFQMTGCTSNDCLVEIGMLLGAQQMVGGSISKFGSTFTVSARIVDVQTGKIIAVSDYDLKGALDDLLTSGMQVVALRLAGTDESQISAMVPTPAFVPSPISPAQTPAVWVEKDPKRAFNKSLFIPGSGQLYVDPAAPKRQLKSNLQLYGAIFCWIMVVGGRGVSADEMNNADYLFSVDPGGRDSTLFDESDATEKNAYEWREDANFSRSMASFFGVLAVVVHVSSAYNARGMARDHNLQKPSMSLYIDPSLRQPRLVLAYRF